MSETCDANVLVYAVDADSPFAGQAQRVVQRFAAGPGPVYLFWPALIGFLRVATHPSILRKPLTVDQAHENVARLVARPHVRAVGEGEAFWRVYADVAQAVVPRGNLVPDTHLVALMRQHGVRTIWTHDSDFHRFPHVEVRDPFV